MTGLQGMEVTGLSTFLLGSVGSTPIMPIVRYCMISTSRQGTSQIFRRLLSVLSFSDVVLKISISPHDDLETSVLGCISREGSGETQEHKGLQDCCTDPGTQDFLFLLRTWVQVMGTTDLFFGPGGVAPSGVVQLGRNGAV